MLEDVGFALSAVVEELEEVGVAIAVVVCVEVVNKVIVGKAVCPTEVVGLINVAEVVETGMLLTKVFPEVLGLTQ